jgi:hypothetical protein
MLMLYVAEDINASSDWSSDQEEEKNSSEFFEIQGIARYMMRGREELIRVLRRSSLPPFSSKRFLRNLTNHENSKGSGNSFQSEKRW